MSSPQIRLEVSSVLIELIEKAVLLPNEVSVLEDGWVVIFEWWDYYRTKLVLLTLSEMSIEVSRVVGTKIVGEKYFSPDQALETILELQASLKYYLERD